MNRRAFTLIELLVVVSIIALLIAILLPSLKKSRTLAKRTVTLAHLRGIGTSTATYANDNRDRYPAFGEDLEGKAFLSLSMLGKDADLASKMFINPNTSDTASTKKTADGRFVLAQLSGTGIDEAVPVMPADVKNILFHCSYAYDSDIKPNKTPKAVIYLGDRADYKKGRTFSANWRGEGMCLLWTDQHAEFVRKKSVPFQSDPNIYHHNEVDAEGGDEVVDGIMVTDKTFDTHIRFFSEEEDDELLPN